MIKIELADEKARNYFIRDYLGRYGKDEDLADRYAEACISLHRSLVLWEHDKIVGGITWSIKEGIVSGIVEIFQISILRSHRGKGYGSMLVDACIKDIETFYHQKEYPLRRIYIIITESNIVGRNLYRSKGFTIEATIKNHHFHHQKDYFYVKDYPYIDSSEQRSHQQL